MGPCFLNILHWVKILCKRRRRIRVSKWLRGWKVVGSDRSCWFWAYFFAIFLALKKGEGVSAALLAIFLHYYCEVPVRSTSASPAGVRGRAYGQV